MCRKQRITSPKRDLSSRKPIGHRLYETENSGGNWTRRRREGRGEKLSGENPLRNHSSHNPRIEAGLAEKRKAPSTGRIAPILEKMVEQMGVEPTTYTMRTYRSSQLSYCPTKNYPILYTQFWKMQVELIIFSVLRRFLTRKKGDNRDKPMR